MASDSKMRAIVIKDGKGPVENLVLGTVDRPVLPPGGEHVLVKIKAFGMNRMDIAQREGRYPPPAGASLFLGVEFAGTVAEVSPGGAGPWAVGDEVFGLAGGGAYAEYIAVRTVLLLPKPARLSWAEAASIPEVFLTAFQSMIMYGEVKAGDHVLVHAGASGVGVAAIQLARLHGAKTVTTTASTAEKLEWLKALPAGATHGVNYKSEDFAKVVRETTGGHGADVVLDFVGRTHWEGNMEALAVDGRMTMQAFMSGNIVEKVNLLPILMKRLRIQGSTLRSRNVEYQSELMKRFSKETLPYISNENGDGKIKTYIHKVYPWTEIQQATQEMAEDKNRGKIVVEVTLD